jgi:tRNA A-37 threonylcarbamoyl transferase component Bud32
MPSPPVTTARQSPVTNTTVSPRLMIITDHTELGRALEQHISIIWPDAECRVHAPLQSGRLHSAFTAVAYDAILLDDRIERGRGEEWLENFMYRTGFPPVIYLAPGDDPGLSERAIRLGALDCLVRERIDHRRLANALKDAVLRRRQELALWRMSGQAEQSSRFGRVKIIGHRFVRELAIGGTSMVYLAESERAGEMVVLKVLRNAADGADEHAQYARFMQEYELISRVRHPNVVRIFDLGIADDHAYIAMEYFPRGDLRAHIIKGIDHLDALSYLGQMAAALQVVHSLGVLHRDLKPGNIMLRNDGTIALIDFGLAKHADLDMDMTGTGEIFGTPYYMSPEQGHGQELDVRSDLYSLGVIFYEMLTRQKPISPRRRWLSSTCTQRGRSRCCRGARTYQQLLNKLLAKDPIHRLPPASALLAKIEELR